MPLATDIYQEGVIIPPVKLYDDGRLNQAGRNALRHRDGQERDLPSKCQIAVEEGDRLTLETAGGGGWGQA
jgi:N-methylhydantoinase B/oxoprolinase/acetone carboxylase alpha subunit